MAHDAVQFQAALHQYNDKMVRLYREENGLVSETLVFWARPSRQRWTQRALERIHLYATRTGLDPYGNRILTLGGGAGNDSIYLANTGLKVDYFAVPGSTTFDFV